MIEPDSHVPIPFRDASDGIYIEVVARNSFLCAEFFLSECIFSEIDIRGP
jgi:hypothetical protein